MVDNHNVWLVHHHLFVCLYLKIPLDLHLIILHHLRRTSCPGADAHVHQRCWNLIMEGCNPARLSPPIPLARSVGESQVGQKTFKNVCTAYFFVIYLIFPCNIKLVLRNSSLSQTSGFLMYYIGFQMSVLLEDNTHWIRVPEDSPGLEKIATEWSQRWTPPSPHSPTAPPQDLIRYLLCIIAWVESWSTHAVVPLLLQVEAC